MILALVAVSVCVVAGSDMIAAKRANRPSRLMSGILYVLGQELRLVPVMRVDYREYEHMPACSCRLITSTNVFDDRTGLPQGSVGSPDCLIHSIEYKNSPEGQALWGAYWRQYRGSGGTRQTYWVLATHSREASSSPPDKP